MLAWRDEAGARARQFRRRHRGRFVDGNRRDA
jgi:hypothetical protein